MTHPSTIEVNFERALYWVQVGAQPTDTARSILSKKGVMYMHHLLKGVKKGAFTEEQAHEKLQTWIKEKEAKLEQLKKDEMLSQKEKTKKIIDEERKINEARAAEIAKKRAKENLKIEEESKAEVAEVTDAPEENQADAASAETNEQNKQTENPDQKETKSE